MKTTPFMWMSLLLFAFGWILLLSGVAALQADCNSGHNALVSAGVAGYFGQVSCSKFYGYTWWITWYAFLIMLLILGLLMAGSLHRFRAGALALLALLTMLLGDLTNTFLFYNPLSMPGAAAGSRGRVTLAGGIVTSIASYVMLILMGLVDERSESKVPTGEPGGETFGGRYTTRPGTQVAPGAMSYNPTYTETTA